MSAASVELARHPSTPAAAVRRIDVRVSRSAQGVLTLTYRLDGDIARLRIPAQQPPALTHNLWQHTCFEAFVAQVDASPYDELNFSPSGEWAAYRFSSYREIAGLADEALAPPISVRTTERTLELETAIDLDRLSPGYGRAALQLGLAAVVEQNDATLSYWSLHHPAGKPDFHHASTRTLRIT